MSRNQISQHQGWALAANPYLRDVMNSVTTLESQGAQLILGLFGSEHLIPPHHRREQTCLWPHRVTAGKSRVKKVI